jgi:hypothetical protein
MIGKMLRAIGMAAVGALALTAAPAQAGGGSSVSFAYTYSSGGYYPRYYKPYPRYYHPPRRVYYVPPPVYYYPPPPPRVVYAPPPPVVYAPAPVQQTLPGGPLASNGPYCREYQSTTVVNGRNVPTYGTACQQPDGSWQIVR